MGNASFKPDLLGILGPTLSLIVLLITGAIARWVGSILNNDRSQIPLVGKAIGNAEQRRKAYNHDARQLYNEGYTKHGTKPFRITTFDGR